MFLVLLILLLHRTTFAQLTVGGWFFPVSVPPPDPRDNTVYDEDVGIPEPEMNVTHQQIKEYYEKDKMEKWNHQKTNLQPVLKKNLELEVHRHHNDEDHPMTTVNLPTYTPSLEIFKSKKFLPDSGIPKFIPTPIGLSQFAANEEPVITMSMTPIQSLNKPEEIQVEGEKNRSQSMELVSSTTEKVSTTKVPFIYGITKKQVVKSFDDPFFDKEKDMVKLKRDVFRLRNEMNLVKALLNKLYKRAYRRQRDFLMKKSSDPTTRLSAIQAERNDNDWSGLFRRSVQRNAHVNT